MGFSLLFTFVLAAAQDQLPATDMAKSPSLEEALPPATAPSAPPMPTAPSPAPAPTPAETTSTKAAKRERPRLVVLDLTNNGIDPALARTFADTLSTALGRGPFDVTTASDLRALTGLEAERQLIKCADASACEAEIASALGASVLVHGSAGKLGGDTIVNLTMYDSDRSAAIDREKVQGRDPARLNNKLEMAAARMIAVYEGKSPPPLPETEDDSGFGLPLVIGGGIAGGVGAVVGALAWLASNGSAGTLQNPKTSTDEKDRATESYFGETTLALVGLGVAVAGGAAVIVGTVIE